MAIKTATIQVRMGLESELDVSKAVPGEWLLSTDTKYIRMCVAYGIVLRMATYESFEADMAKIKELVSTAQSLKDIVMRLASEVSSKTTIVLEATEEAKKYMEEAKKYSELAFATTPDGYEVLVRDVDLLKNSIVQTTDRTLYGSKAGGIKLIGVKGASEQAVYSGAQLLNYEVWKTVGYENGTAVFENNGVTVTATKNDAYTQFGGSTFPEELKIFVSEGDVITMSWETDTSNTGLVYILGNAGTTSMKNAYAKSGKVVYTVPSGITFITYRFGVAYAGDTISYKNIMINKGDTALPWEPYTGNAPSPSPSYPQEIESVGDSGSLVIEQVGKNLLENTATTQTINGVTFTVNEDKSVTVNGTATALIQFSLHRNYTLPAGEYILSGCPEGGGNSTFCLAGSDRMGVDYGSGRSYTAATDTTHTSIYICIFNGITVSNLTFNPMIRKADIEDDAFEPYHSNTIIIPLNEPLREGDEIAVVDELWNECHDTQKTVFDGSDDEDWGVNSSIESWFFTENFDQGAFYNNDGADFALCTHYIQYHHGDIVNIPNGKFAIGFSNASNRVRLVIKDSRFTTVADFKAWLAKNPITVEYKLSTPVFETFTDQTPFYQMQSYDTVTYISTDSKVEPSIEVKFGRTEGDAITLLNYNQTNLNRIAIEKLINSASTASEEDQPLS